MLPLKIALRYLLSRKSHGAVNVISAVAMAGVAVAAAAMIIILSVFNGFSQLVERKTAGFNPPLLIVPATGKIIADADSLAGAIASVPGIAVAAPLIDEQAFAIAGDAQMPVSIRALPPEALAASGLRDILIDGALDPAEATVSVGVAVSLNVRPLAEERRFVDGPSEGWINVYEPLRSGRINPANPMGAFRGDSLRVTGVYQVEQEEQDRDMLVIPLAVARRLLDYTTEASAVAVYPSQTEGDASDAGRPGNAALASLRQSLESRLPSDSYRVLDRLEQEAEAYRMIAVEKWITFLMLLFILAVASFNIVSTLSLMVVEKEKNMAVLGAMGAAPSFIRRIFGSLGWLITIIGSAAGLLLGTLLTLGQQHFGWVKLSSANPSLMAINYYPVRLDPTDLMIVLLAVLLTSLLIAIVGALCVPQPRR